MAKEFQIVAKRVLDVAGATTLGIVLSPVMAFTALAIRRELGAPILFRQTRLGQNAQPFTIYKFRTMHPESEQPERTAERTTALTRQLRRFKLDELPQLWNVLKGDMSLVGPRPLEQRHLPELHARHYMRPGLTGLSQVHGWNAETLEQCLQVDTHYIRTWSLRQDFNILCRTISTVLSGKASPEAPRPEPR